MAFENSDFILSQEHFKHIQERHIRMDLHPRASKFRRNFNLVSCLAWLTKKPGRKAALTTSERRGLEADSILFTFSRCQKVIGFDPRDFPSKEICVYYSWKRNTDGRFCIISAYPYSSPYHHFLMVRKTGYL